jgi:hypothetical protein
METAAYIFFVALLAGSYAVGAWLSKQEPR